VANTIMTAARRRIAVVTGSRADYGLLRGILTRLQKMDDVDLQVIVCGMHLLPKFGETWRIIEADGFPIAAKIDLELNDDRAETVARGTGIGVAGFSEALPKLAPDLLVVLGDRYEILSAAVAATLLNIPIAHIHGGEVTAGAFDDAIRHAITKMACVHFAAAEPYRRRVIQMGENPDFVFNVGAPGLDLAAIAPAISRPTCSRTRHQPTGTLPARDPASDHRAARCRCRERQPELLGALAQIEDRSFIFTGVNADPGYRTIDDAVRTFVAARPGRAHLFASLGSERYWAALRLADAVSGQFVERHPGGAGGRSSLGQYRRPPARPVARGVDHRLPGRPNRDSRSTSGYPRGPVPARYFERTALWSWRRIGEDC
jgi:UDP-hydrolysing UDP-N-acetyl-D-glucosamine 2-epimerase